jgi:hypothetical protein
MISVFKTSVKTRTQIKKLKPHIDEMLPRVKWNFDLHDIDNILRVDSAENISSTIIEVLNMHKYSCEELE